MLKKSTLNFKSSIDSIDLTIKQHFLKYLGPRFTDFFDKFSRIFFIFETIKGSAIIRTIIIRCIRSYIENR